MLSPVCFAPVFNSEDPKPESKTGFCCSLLGRVMPSKEKGILGSNLILIIMAFAYAFFSLKLRLLGIGLGLYGMITTAILANRLNKATKSINEVEGLQETVQGLKGKSSLNNLALRSDQEIKEKQVTLQKLTDQIKKQKDQVKKLSNNVMNLKLQVRSLENMKKKS